MDRQRQGIGMRIDRRHLLQTATCAAAWLGARGAFAEALAATARTTEGPFYPDKMPLDTDNDLLLINDAVTPGVGEITHLTGRLLSASGEPVRNAFIEIWQTDVSGNYLHSEGRNDDGSYDGNFQGYGRFLTDSHGRYYFRTIKPVEYTLQGMFRAPHIHFAISLSGNRALTTQALVRGHEANERDFLIRRLGPDTLETVLVDYVPLPDSPLGELNANFDIVLGRTAEELEDGTLGALGRPERRNRYGRSSHQSGAAPGNGSGRK